jgi:hypothetical protein
VIPPPTSPDRSEAPPLLLFGAFDRHNFGDLLFPHIAAALLPERQPIFAGLAARDLRAHGGHRVAALAEVAAAWGGRPIDILHVGGELLTCDAWQAAVMLLPPDEAQTAMRRFERDAAAGRAWARERLGTPALAPYAAAGMLFPQARRVAYNAVGGVDLQVADPALRAEVLGNLAAADAVSVRDRRTLALLEAQGVSADLVPDPAVMVAELFGERISRRAETGEVGRMREAFPRGYLAVQFSADFGDDATLAAIAAQLDEVSAASGLGVVFFRAGAAPWHDDLECYRRLAARMFARTEIFGSLDLWNLCALIAASRGYCGSSLHGRIVAMACGLPRLNLCHPSLAGRPTKQAAYADTWDVPGMPTVVGVAEVATGVLAALGQEVQPLRAAAARWVAACRSAFVSLAARLEMKADVTIAPQGLSRRRSLR